ncbi:MAG: GH32 C-terminal domain-containing protein [Microbacteriaceae bacterium]|nr:GH32 C-terminal domain-containing protein [Microbacteriaceae bacterium]MCL2796175.1 GH32 C-terminal domain-containing protein [Microbacteriaceae bacterium]
MTDIDADPLTHFRPADGYVGDVIPFEHNGTVWLYYLLDERAGRLAGMPWAAVTTRDFVRFEDRGVVLPSGGRHSADFDCYTGSVVEDAGGTLHLFYTGHNPDIRTRDGDDQVVCHATSEGDPARWKKHPEWTFGAMPGHSAADWRDPFVFRPSDDSPWQMLLAARRADAPYRRSGTVARLFSDDLITWRTAEPLWDPHRFIAQECPDVFRWGEWWYLVYSEFSDSFQTRYRMARTPDGPWIAPEHDTVDGRAFYASKTVELDGDRFFIGWIASKEGDRDDGAWQWAGTMATLQAHQRADGSLRFMLPAAIVADHPFGAGGRSDLVDTLRPLDDADATPGTGAATRHSSWLGPVAPDKCVIIAEFDIQAGTHACGLLVRASADGETAYVLRLEPLRHRLVFDRWPRRRSGGEQWQIDGDVPHAVELERPVQLPPGRHTVRVHLDRDILVAVVDDEVALSTRVYDLPDGRVGVFATDGEAELTRLEVRTRDSR